MQAAPVEVSGYQDRFLHTMTCSSNELASRNSGDLCTAGAAVPSGSDRLSSLAIALDPGQSDLSLATVSNT